MMFRQVAWLAFAATREVVHWASANVREVVRLTEERFAGSGDAPPLANYDSMSTREIARLVPHLRPGELNRIDVYERARLARPVVLDAVGRQFDHEPWPGYHLMPADDIVIKLVIAPRATFEYAIAYERRNLNRPTIVYS